MIVYFTDNEYAVIMDSLSQTRERINGETPTIDSTISKLGSFAKPSGCEFTAVTGVDMHLILGASDHPEYSEAAYQAARKEENA